MSIIEKKHHEGGCVLSGHHEGDCVFEKKDLVVVYGDGGMMPQEKMETNAAYGKKLQASGAYGKNPRRPPESDFARIVFSTDARVLRHVKAKAEIRGVEDEKDKEALRLTLGTAYGRGAQGLAPEAEWYGEAQELSQRVGKRWDSTPQPTLVEALARKEDHWPLEFARLRLGPGESGYATARTQTLFRGRRLVLGPVCVADHLVVMDLKVGNMMSICSGDPIPGCIFSDTAFPLWLTLDTAHPGQTICLGLTNTGPGLLDVMPVLHGNVIEQRYRDMEILYEDSDSVWSRIRSRDDER